MVNKTFTNKFWLVAGLSLIFLAPSLNAFARDRGDKGRSRHEVVRVGRQSYHYRDGRFYRPSWFGFEIVVAVPPLGAIVRVLPFGHSTVIVGGTTYYYRDNVYYRLCPSGYIVVSQPVVNPGAMSVPSAVQAQKLSDGTVTINVPNSNGSYTSVTLLKHNNGYIGPQGEYYPGQPTVDQLKVLYVK